MLAVGTYIKVHRIGPTGQIYLDAKGFIRSIGAGIVTIENDKGYNQTYKLNGVALEKAAPLADALNTRQSLGIQPQIRNRCTGSGFTDRSVKVRMDPKNNWETTNAAAAAAAAGELRRQKERFKQI